MLVTDEKFDALMDALQSTIGQLVTSAKRQDEMQQTILRLLERQQTIPQSPPRDQAVGNANIQKSRKSNSTGTRPTANIDMDDMQWVVFVDSWNRYTKMENITGERDACLLELRAACSTDVNQQLYEFVGPDKLDARDLSVEKLLEHIKTVAVRTVHVEVHRWKFANLRQENGESSTKFVSRIKAHASLCQFSSNCDCGCGRSISYADNMVSQQMIIGLANQEYQSTLLNEAAQLKTLQMKIDRLVSLESTEDAATQFTQVSTSGAAKFSLYKQSQRSEKRPEHREKSFRGRAFPPRGKDRRYNRNKQSPRNLRCRGCGNKAHASGKSMTRKDCPAFGQKCDNCGIDNHFAKVCEKRQSRSSRIYAMDELSGQSSASEFEWSDSESYCADTSESEYERSRSSVARVANAHKDTGFRRGRSRYLIT